MSDPTVDVHVGELVLDGLPESAAETVAGVVRAELARGLAGIAPGTPPDAVAAATERAVADALGAAG